MADNNVKGNEKAKPAETHAGREERPETGSEKRDLRLGLRKKPRRIIPQVRKELWGTSKRQKRKG